MKGIKTIAVIGAGPVGCVLTAHITDKHVVLLCDLNTSILDAACNGIIVMNKDGEIEFQRYPNHTFAHIADMASDDPDIVFIATKANANKSVADELAKIHRNGRVYVCWQNGIDTEHVFADVLGRENVMRAVVNYGCGFEAPAVVQMAFHHPPHYIQEMDHGSRDKTDAIAKMLVECDLQTEWTGSIREIVWHKAIMNSAMNPVCALTGMTMAQVMGKPHTRALVDGLVRECIKIAHANSIDLGTSCHANAMEYMGRAGPHKPSMLLDIEANRQTEIDYLNGMFVEHAHDCSVEAPLNQTMFALIKGLESTRLTR
ncbi:MAG: 2-dehydropantoate 2-reductase [Patescibacteria group bacterium]